MKHIKLIIYFFIFFSLPIYADDSATSGDGINRDCSNMELISELNNISTLVTHTESGTVRDDKPDTKDTYDYYYFNIVTNGTIDIIYTSTKDTDLYLSNTGCGDNKVINNGRSGSGSFSVTAGQVIYIGVKDEESQEDYNNAYNIKLTFTPDLPLPPTISGIPDQNIQIGNSLSINLSDYTTEPNGDPVTYAATGLPTGMSIDTSTGLITGTPTVVGTFNLTVTATDKDGSDSDSFIITVTAPPVIANGDSFATPPNTPLSDNFISNDSGYNIQATAITVQPSNGTVTYQASGFFTYTPTIGYTGIDSFTYQITDSLGHTATATVSINVVLNTNYQSGVQDFTLINPPNTRNIIGNYAIAGNTVECITTDQGVTAGNWVWNGQLWVWVPAATVTVADFTNLTCTNDNSYNDNGYMSKYIDIDNDTSTWNSSSSNFTLPSTSNGILWAGLFWQGAINNKPTESGRNTDGSYYRAYRTQRRASLSDGNIVYTYINADQAIDLETSNANKILLKINTNNYESIQASTFYYDTAYDTSGGFYAAYADVTSFLQDKNLTDGNHTATIANLVTNEGRESSIGNIGGWSLVVIYNESGGGAKARNLSVYNGYTTISSTSGTRSVQISGFKLPSSGTVNSSFSAFAGEGEFVYGTPSNSFDRMFVSKFSDLSSPQNMPGATDPNNIFDAILANISRDSGNDNDVSNANGIDIENYDVSDIMTIYRDENPNIDTIYIGLESGQDYITPSMMAFATELYRPKVCIDYTVQKDRYDITQDGRAIDTKGTGDLSVTLALQSLEGDFDFTNSQIGVRLVPTSNTSFDNAYYAPNNVNTFIQGIPAGGSFTAPSHMMGIGENITSSGGTIRRFQRYFARFDYNLLASYTGKFEVDLNTTINFGSGDVPSFQSTQYEDIERCEQNLTYNPIKGSYNIERTDSANYDGVTHPELKYPLYTQIVGKDFDFRLVAYNQSSTPAYTDELALTDYTVDLELIDAAPFNDAQSVFTCNNPDPNIIQTLDSSNRDNVFVHFPNSTNGEAAITSVDLSSLDIQTNRALKNAAFRMWYIVDENNTILPHLCADENSNSCFETLYNEYIRASDTTLQADGTVGFCHSACSASSNYTYTNKAGKSGCYACLHDFFARAVCSRDNFAIRPASYRVKISDNGENTDPTVASTQVGENDTSFTPPAPFAVTTLAAGYYYKLDGIATSYINDTTVALGYYREFNTPGSAISSTLSFDTDYVDPNNVNSVNCVDKNSTYWNIEFYNGTMQNIVNYTQSNLKKQSEIGQYLYHIEDANWTLVDQDSYEYKTFHGVNDCITTDSSVSPTSTGKSGCKTNTIVTVPGEEYTDLTLIYQPYKFDISGVTYQKHPDNGKTYTYLNDFNNTTYYNPAAPLIDMSVSFEGNISAKGADDLILKNFTNLCLADDISLELTRTTSPDERTLLKDQDGNLIKFQQFLQHTSILNPFIDKQEGIDKNVTFLKVAFSESSSSPGTATMYLHTTFKKPLNSPVNPFKIQYEDINAKGADSLRSFADMSTHTPDANNTYDQNLTYYFAKVTPLSYRYQNVLKSYKNTPIYVDIFCSYTPCNGYGDLNLSSQNPDETADWHDASNIFDNLNDGTTNLIAGTDSGANANPAVTPNNNVAFTDGPAARTDINVTISGAGRPSTVGIDIRPVPWLLYDSINASGFPHYQVEFIDSAGWSGVGNTGKVVETKSSNQGRQRMNW